MEEQQSNKKLNQNVASVGLNMDSSLNQIKSGQLTYALNAVVENTDSNSLSYQNELGNELCITFPKNYKLIGSYIILEQNKILYFLVNEKFNKSEIGYSVNKECKYNILINADCLNFNINFPIHKIVHRITNCSTEIYFTDGKNERRYLDIDNLPYKTLSSESCEADKTDEIDCNKLLVQPNFKIPDLKVINIVDFGDNKAGTYQFAIQFGDESGNGYTSFYSITNPCPLFDVNVVTLNFNYNIGKSVVIEISNLEQTGNYQYFNLAVIKTINNIPAVELVGTYFIDKPTKQITYTGQQVDNIKLTIQDIFEKFPYYNIANDLTTVQDVLVWSDLLSISQVNYQSIWSKVKLQWASYRLPADDNFSKEINATNYRGYLRDEIYALEGVFLLTNGKQTDKFHIPAREASAFDLELLSKNDDFLSDKNEAQRYKVYNTAVDLGFSINYNTNLSYKGEYKYGEFAYWESSELYPCNELIWGDLANKPIRHHKMPDCLVSPIFENPVHILNSSFKPIQQNNAIFTLGIKINNEQIKDLIRNSNLTQQQKDEIVGYKIIRGNRDTNKSIVAKGLLRNMGTYTKEEETFFYPNYPYNDLETDPFLNLTNNAWSNDSEKFNINVLSLPEIDNEGSFVKIEYTNSNSNKKAFIKYRTLGLQSLCSISKPILASPGVSNNITYNNILTTPIINSNNVVTISYANYDVWKLKSINPNIGDVCGGYKVSWQDYMSDTLMEVYVGGAIGDAPRTRYIYTKPDVEWTCIEYCNRCGRRSEKLQMVRVNSCKTPQPLKAIKDDINLAYRHVFNSPETSFAQPFLGNVLKLENVLYGEGKAHFVEVKKNAKYKLLTEFAQYDALKASAEIGQITNPFNAQVMFATYQAYLTIYINGITKKNYAQSFNSIASYDYYANIDNNQNIKQRKLELKQYLIPGVQNVGDTNNINNFNRESSVYLKTQTDITALPYPNKTKTLLNNNNSIITEKSRITIEETSVCSMPAKEQSINVISYYGAIKNINLGQYGQIYTYDSIDTGHQILFQDNIQQESIIFGGDTFIGKHTFKTKLSFFTDDRVNASDDSDIFYDEIGNIAYPKYWHSSRSILKGFREFPNLISYKAHNFECYNNPTYSIANKTTVGTNNTFYDGYYYLYAYGVPSFYCESSYNLDFRQAFNNKEGDFFPHVSNGIPDDWLQQTNVPIQQDNTYYYNVTYSKQNKENYFSSLPIDWEKLCKIDYSFRAIYSEPRTVDLANTVNNWLIYKSVSYEDFPQNYGKLTSLDGIQNKAILARFENKSFMYGNLLTLDTSNPQAAYLGNNKLFKGAPPIDFGEVDLGYMGSQNKFILKTPQGQIVADCKRGQIFLIQGTQAEEITGANSGINRFITDHLAFKILNYFPNYNTDNHFNGIGIHGIYDSKFERVLITKLDYIPLNKNIKYDYESKIFYILNNNKKEEVFLEDDEMFINKSFTLSFNFNTKSWIAFHSYLPNFYIGENNFFYSGLNNDIDLDIEFEVKKLQ